MTTANVIDKKSENAVIGEKVHTLMWRAKRTQAQLADLLGVHQSAVSNRLKGKTDWTAVELAITAGWLGVEISDLVPQVNQDGADGQFVGDVNGAHGRSGRNVVDHDSSPSAGDAGEPIVTHPAARHSAFENPTP